MLVESNTIYLWNDLMYLLQSATQNTSDYIIAREMILRFNDITDMKLEELANYCNVSPGTISKFLKKVGYGGFGTVKERLSQQNRQDIQIKEIKNAYKPEDYLDAFLIYDSRLTTRVLENLKINDNVKELYHSINKDSTICIITPDYVSETAISFARNCKDEGIKCITIDRKADQDLMLNLINTCNIIIIISSSGKWIVNEKQFIQKINDKNKKTFVVGTDAIIDYVKYFDNIIPATIGKENDVLNSHYSSTRYFSLFFTFITLNTLKKGTQDGNTNSIHME